MFLLDATKVDLELYRQAYSWFELPQYPRSSWKVWTVLMTSSRPLNDVRRKQVDSGRKPEET
jgi:hypothetical protein